MFQVQRDELQLIEVLIDGIPRVIEYEHELQSAKVFIRNDTRESYPRIILAFSSGITVYVESATVLQMAVAVPVEFKGRCVFCFMLCITSEIQLDRPKVTPTVLMSYYN